MKHENGKPNGLRKHSPAMSNEGESEAVQTDNGAPSIGNKSSRSGVAFSSTTLPLVHHNEEAPRMETLHGRNPSTSSVSTSRRGLSLLEAIAVDPVHFAWSSPQHVGTVGGASRGGTRSSLDSKAKLLGFVARPFSHFSSSSPVDFRVSFNHSGPCRPTTNAVISPARAVRQSRTSRHCFVEEFHPRGVHHGCDVVSGIETLRRTLQPTLEHALKICDTPNRAYNTGNIDQKGDEVESKETNFHLSEAPKQ